MARTAGHSDFLAGVLAAAATYRAMAGEPERARVLAAEGLAVARRLEAPSFLALNLVALAAASAEDDPDRANSLLAREHCATTASALKRRASPRRLSLSAHASATGPKPLRVHHPGDPRVALGRRPTAPRRRVQHRCSPARLDRTPRPPQTSKAPHAASSPASPTAEHSSKRALTARGTKLRVDRSRFRHDTAPRDHG